MRLDIAAGTAVRFEPGQERDVTLVPLGGKREVYGFQTEGDGQAVMRFGACLVLASSRLRRPQPQDESTARTRWRSRT